MVNCVKLVLNSGHFIDDIGQLGPASLKLELYDIKHPMQFLFTSYGGLNQFTDNAYICVKITCF